MKKTTLIKTSTMFFDSTTEYYTIRRCCCPHRHYYLFSVHFISVRFWTNFFSLNSGKEREKDKRENYACMQHIRETSCMSETLFNTRSVIREGIYNQRDYILIVGRTFLFFLLEKKWFSCFNFNWNDFGPSLWSNLPWIWFHLLYLMFLVAGIGRC